MPTHSALFASSPVKLGEIEGAKAKDNSFCLESAWNNGACEPGCNILECDYNECTNSQIIDRCVPREELARIDYSTSPVNAQVTTESFAETSRYGGLAPVNLQLNLEPARMSIDDQVNEVVLFQVMEYTLQWSDPRLFTAPCFGALSSMLSMSEEDALSDITRQRVFEYRRSYWLPTPNYEPLLPGYDAFDESASVTLSRSAPWNEGVAAPGAKTCEHCVEYQAEVELQVLQAFDLFYFPFDTQTIKWTFKVPGAHLYACQGDGAQALLNMGGLVQVRAAMIAGGGRLDPRRPQLPYSKDEARRAFWRVAQQHGWERPDSGH